MIHSLALLLLACTPDDPGTGDDTGTTGGEQAPERTPPAYSAGACPALEDGVIEDFATGDTRYRVKVVLPPDPQGAPLLFAWHWLGGSSGDIVRYMELDDLAEAEGAIVIAPDSDGSDYEWHFLDDPDGNPDLQLFDDLLSCAWEQHDVDMERVHALGMSAGGLQTTYLTLYRAQWLASTAIFSGGTLDGMYETPAWPLPVLVTWGGAGDTYGSLSFDATSTYLSEQLQADGSFVVECEHTLGHQIPDGATTWAWRFLADHPYGVDPEPYVQDLPDDFPDYCRVP